MADRLAGATSPYLLQHAANPVDWWPWSDAAFEAAARRDVPVMLSVGYSACHWCHVMAHESFEDEPTAALMNEHLVAIKVDREERPDVDAIYMSATQAMTGQGGWPMTVFLTPDREPFYCGTYFPRANFQRLVLGVAKAWRDDRAGVADQARQIAAALAEQSGATGDFLTRDPAGAPEPGGPGTDAAGTGAAGPGAAGTGAAGTGAAGSVLIDTGAGEDEAAAGRLAAASRAAVSALAAEYDEARGGFGGAPKFPPSMILEFLLRHAELDGAATASRATAGAANGAAGDRAAAGGAAASAGADGEAGAAGADGEAGAAGADGEAGAAGADGEAGAAGTDGAARADGAAGADGAARADGEAGAAGEAGADGAAAAAGGGGQALAMATGTAAAMARGGLYDQLAGGFARYSTDADWIVPHFEKMLYDNALLARVYTHLWRLTGDELAGRVARETCAWMIDELRTTEGGFAAALDADSEGAEGAFYVWTPAQLAAELGAADGAYAAGLFGVTAAGTFEHGASVLQLRADPADPQEYARVRAALLAARARRVRPGRDDKVVAAWNGLAIAALAEAGLVLAEPRFTAAARDAAQLLATVHLDAGRLARTSRDGVPGSSAGVLEDYGNVAEGFIALSGVTGEARWAALAGELLDTALDRFAGGSTGFYDTADDSERLIYRPADPADGPSPSGTFAVAGALLSYAALTGSDRYRAAAATALVTVPVLAQRFPRAAGWGLAVAAARRAGPVEIAVVGPAGDPRTAELHRTALLAAPPGTVLALGDPAATASGPPPGGVPAGGAGAGGVAAGGAGEDGAPAAGAGAGGAAAGGAVLGGGAAGGPTAGGAVLGGAAAGGPTAGGTGASGRAAIPLLEGRGLVGGAPAAYVCRGFTCRAPVTSPDDLRTELRLA